MQSGHASIQFQHDHPDQADNWYYNSNYLIFLTVKDEEELYYLMGRLEREGINYSAFKEPDMDNEVTAISFLSDERTKKLTSGFKLLK